MDNQCNYVIRPPKIDKGRLYVRSPRRCKRKAQEHGRCWQHHDIKGPGVGRSRPDDLDDD